MRGPPNIPPGMGGAQLVVPRHTYICHNGHEMRLPAPFRMMIPLGPNEGVMSLPACPICYTEWFSKVFPAIELDDDGKMKIDPPKLEMSRKNESDESQ